MIKCSCGKKHNKKPADAKYAPDAILPGHYFNCSCGSTDVWPLVKEGHTPGPWLIHRDADRKEIIVSGKTRGWGPDHLFSCSDVPELASNAALISAAPEMLDALEAFVEEYHSLSRLCAKEHQILRAAERAIAKARGE